MFDRHIWQPYPGMWNQAPRGAIFGQLTRKGALVDASQMTTPVANQEYVSAAPRSRDAGQRHGYLGGDTDRTLE